MKRSQRKNHKKSHKKSKKTNKCTVFKSSLKEILKLAKEAQRQRKRSHKKLRFGRMPGLNAIMGNTPGEQMSVFQAYTGMGPYQMDNHMNNIDSQNRDNFYSTV